MCNTSPVSFTGMIYRPRSTIPPQRPLFPLMSVQVRHWNTCLDLTPVSHQFKHSSAWEGIRNLSTIMISWIHWLFQIWNISSFNFWLIYPIKVLYGLKKTWEKAFFFPPKSHLCSRLSFSSYIQTSVTKGEAEIPQCLTRLMSVSMGQAAVPPERVKGSSLRRAGGFPCPPTHQDVMDVILGRC